MAKNNLNYQEKFWRGDFGNNYIKRNSNINKWVSNNIFFFKNCFKKIKKTNIKNIIEYGPNIGLNLIALNKIFKSSNITGVEINKKACEGLSKLKYVEAINKSAFNYKPKKKYNLILSKGFLIHINPKKIAKIYRNIFNTCSSKGFILIAEYYSQKPVNKTYRGKKNVLFKRDFAGEILKIYDKKIKLIDYGFAYHKAKNPQDDLTWFLLQKK